MGAYWKKLGDKPKVYRKMVNELYGCNALLARADKCKSLVADVNQIFVDAKNDKVKMDLAGFKARVWSDIAGTPNALGAKTPEDFWKKNFKNTKGAVTAAQVVALYGCKLSLARKGTQSDEREHCTDFKRQVDAKFKAGGEGDNLSYPMFLKLVWNAFLKDEEDMKGVKPEAEWKRITGGDTNTKATKTMVLKTGGCTAAGKPLPPASLAKSTDEAEHCKDVKSIVDREFGDKNKVTWEYFQKTSWPRVKGEFPKGTKAGDVWKKAVGGKGKKATKKMFKRDAGRTAAGNPRKSLARDEAQHCKDVKSIVDREFGDKNKVTWEYFQKTSWPRVKGG